MSVVIGNEKAPTALRLGGSGTEPWVLAPSYKISSKDFEYYDGPILTVIKELNLWSPFDDLGINYRDWIGIMGDIINIISLI